MNLRKHKANAETDSHCLQRQSLHLNPKGTPSTHADFFLLFSGEISLKLAKLVAQMKSHYAVVQQQIMLKQTEE